MTECFPPHYILEGRKASSLVSDLFLCQKRYIVWHLMINSCKLCFLEIFCPLEHKPFITKMAALSRFLYRRWYSCSCVKNVLLACLPFTWLTWWRSEEPPWLLFTVLRLVKGFLKLINVLVFLPTWKQKCVCMCVCAPMCACLYAHPTWAVAIPRAASSKAVSVNLLSVQSRSAGPAQLLCMLSTKQISLEWGGGKKIEGSICSFLLHCADARLR